jgi:hypothetical protein
MYGEGKKRKKRQKERKVEREKRGRRNREYFFVKNIDIKENGRN